MSKNPTALYLHGGPGLNSAVERIWFGENYPVLWWDQPRFSANAENAYQATLDAAAEKLAEFHARQEQPIDVIGSSFGARLALDLAHRAPESIGTLILLAPTLCLETAFDRIARYLSDKGKDIPALATSVPPNGNGVGQHERFMQRVIGILSIPDLFSRYWAPVSGAQFASHCAETANTNWFDLDTFTAVSRDVMTRPIVPLPAGQVGRVHIFAGRYDPYFDLQTDLDLWKKIFPEVSIRIEESGHMIPFEIPAAEWLNPIFPPSVKGDPTP